MTWGKEHGFKSFKFTQTIFRLSSSNSQKT